jgi:hypothetical protein
MRMCVRVSAWTVAVRFLLDLGAQRTWCFSSAALPPNHLKGHATLTVEVWSSLILDIQLRHPLIQSFRAMPLGLMACAAIFFSLFFSGEAKHKLINFNEVESVPPVAFYNSSRHILAKTAALSIL